MDLACWNTGYLVDLFVLNRRWHRQKKIGMHIHQNDTLCRTKIDLVELVSKSDTQHDDGVRPDVHIEQTFRLLFRDSPNAGGSGDRRKNSRRRLDALIGLEKNEVWPA